VIFCRNVIIYFDRPRQERIVQKCSSAMGRNPPSAD
jgi:chemotaxis methyl-accepting protein methylase